MAEPSGAPSPATRGRGLYLGRPLGVPVYLSLSWVLIAVLVMLQTAPEFARSARGSAALPAANDYLLGLVTSVLLAMSVLLHELGHSAVSVAMGVPVRRITLFMLGGVSEISREADSAAREYLVAIAGPLVSVTLTGICYAVVRHSGGRSVLSDVAGATGWYNGTLAAFNLLPGLPLDGGRIVRAAAWGVTGNPARSSRIAMRCGQGLAVAIGGFALYLSTLVQPPNPLALLFPLLIAAFIYASNSHGLRRLAVLDRLHLVDVRTLTWPIVEVPADLPLAEALRRAREQQRRLLVVDSYGRPAAVINAAKLQQVPETQQPWVPVGSVSRALEPGLVLDANLRGDAVVAALQTTPASEYLVVEPGGERVVGVLAARDVVHRLEPVTR